jgi:uncharacterized spore protein YtfJ
VGKGDQAAFERDAGMEMTMDKLYLPEMDKRVLVGKEIKAGDRTIWPVIKITVMKNCEDKVQAIQLTPLAMLIVEPTGSYAVSFAGQPMTIEAIFDLAPPLRDVLEKMGKYEQD